MGRLPRHVRFNRATGRLHLSDIINRVFAFPDVEYGEAPILNGKMQHRPTAIDKEERNQCTHHAVSAGIVAIDLKPNNTPTYQ